MRDELRPLKGQLTAVKGTITSFGHRKELFCLSNCLLKVWDRKTDLKSYLTQEQEQPAVRCDHLWVSATNGHQIKRYITHGVIGRISWYFRANGSKDLGLIGPGSNMNITEHILLRLNAAIRTEKDITIFHLLMNIKSYIKKHKEQDLILWDNDVSLDWLENYIDEMFFHYKKIIDSIYNGINSGATQNGKCNLLRKVNCIPHKSLKKVSGFK